MAEIVLILCIRRLVKDSMELYSQRGLVLSSTRNHYFKINLSDYDCLSLSGKMKGEHSSSQKGKQTRDTCHQ